MRTIFWTVIITVPLMLTTQFAHAKTAAGSTAESVGVGTGAIVGAAAGGPVGFIIGAAIGAKVGDSVNQKNATIETLQTDVDRLRTDIRSVNAALDDAESRTRPELLALLQTGIEMDLLFRTDETVLMEATGERLNKLAMTIASMPDVRIRLDGFADERGDSDYNQALSEQRIASVRQLLLDAGVSRQRIDAVAHGEVVSTDGTLDSLALERRVSVRLYVDDAQAVAAGH